MLRAALLCLLLAPALAAGASAELYQRLDALHARRDDPEVARELDTALGAELDSGDYGILWRAARHKGWLAEGLPAGELKERLGKESWDLGERAAAADPTRVEGQYYAAVGLGFYAQTIGMLRALRLGVEGKFNERIDAAMRIDPDFDHGAPRIVKGRYWYELPWPKRDLEKSHAEYVRALRDHPENLRGHLYLAETLLRQGKAAEAKQSIERALQGGTDYNPPEGRRVQQLAAPVQAQIEGELR